MGGESEAAWRSLLDDLVLRGLKAPGFVTVERRGVGPGDRRPRVALTHFWWFDSRDADDASLEQVEFSPAIHLTFDELEFSDLSFSLTVRPA
jgi:hypothetical protein